MGLTTKVCNAGYKKLCIFLMAVGPGLIVMLADTDVGSLITAAQSGAIWGYKFLLLQLVLIPFLYIVQELTLRLGFATQRGHGELIKQHFGNFWAWLSVGTLVIACVGALISELSGIAGVGAMFGVPNWLSMTLTVVFILLLVLTRSYNSVERVALAIGAFELVYLFVAWKAHPSGSEIIADFKYLPFHHSNFLYLVSANIGAVIMPWMIFYQQSAIIDKQLSHEHFNSARIDTAIGAVITQVIMSAVIIAVAATIGKTNPGIPLNTIDEISKAITVFLGPTVGKVLFALGMLGASLVATIVLLLAAAWSFGEITGCKHSLQDNPKEAPWFYGILCITLIGVGIFVSTDIHLVNLNVAIEVMNSLLLPIVLGFLYLLALKTLPEPYRLKKWYAIVVGFIVVTISAIGVISGLWGIIAK